MLYAAPVFNAAFINRLQALGYHEGRNLDFEAITNDVPLDRLPELAMDMASRRPDVMCGGGGAFVLDALKRAAGTTPIVMLFIDFDPVARGYVASLSRPGGSITGLYLQQVDLAPKKLELLVAAVPSAKRIAILFDDASRDQQQVAQSAAPSLGVTLLPQELRGSPYDYDAALRAAASDKAEAALILSSGAFFPGRFTLMSAIQKHRLPSMASLPFRDAGAMLCYGANFFDMYTRAAEYVDHILKGQKPADMAIEQPTKYEFIINFKTARSLDITIPDSMLRRADEVIR